MRTEYTKSSIALCTLSMYILVHCTIILCYSAMFYSTLIGSHTDVDYSILMSAMRSMQWIFRTTRLSLWLYIQFTVGSSLRRFPHTTNCYSHYSSPSVHLHTYTILFYSPEGDRPGPSTLQGKRVTDIARSAPTGYPGQQWSQVSSFARAS